MNNDIECKHKELQNLMRIQEDPSRRNKICIDGIAESAKENWEVSINYIVTANAARLF